MTVTRKGQRFMGRVPDSRRRRRCSVVAAVATLVFVGAACGNSHSEEAIARAAGVRIDSPAAAQNNDALPAETEREREPVAERPAAEPAPGTATAPSNAGDSSRPVAPGGPAAPPSAGRATSAPPPSAGTANPGSKPAAAPGRPASTGPAVGAGQAPAQAGCTANSKAPVIIGTVGHQSGPIGLSTNPGVKAVQAWAAGKNSQGGIDCHPVKYIVADDGGDPARHLSLVKQLVEQERVIGFVYMNAVLSGHASVQYLNDKQVPVISDDGGGIYFESPMHFPAWSNGKGLIDLTMAAGARATIPLGLKRLALITCQEASFCSLAADRWAKGAARHGYTVVYRGQASIGQPDYTSQCLAAQSAGADVIMLVFEPNSVKRLRSSCTSVGFDAPIVLTSTESTLEMKDDPKFEGTVIAQQALPWFLDDRPVIREYQATLRKFGPRLPIDQTTSTGYAAAKLFERVATGRLSDTPSSQNLLQGLWSLRGDDLGGWTYPITFRQGATPGNGQPCGWVVLIKGGHHTSDGQRFCDEGAPSWKPA